MKKIVLTLCCMALVFLNLAHAKENLKGNKMAQNTIYIVHGFDSAANKNWFEWLEKKLVADGNEVKIFTMPNPQNPTLQEWTKAIKEQAVKLDENTYFVGHSLGCISILRYIEGLDLKTKIGGIVLVSGFDKPLSILPVLDPFVAKPLDSNKIVSIVKKRIVISAKDDQIVPTEFSKALATKLKAKFIQTPKGNHFMDSDGFKELPIAYEALKEEFTK